MQKNNELYAAAILGISFAIAISGMLAYAILAPIPPAIYVAMGHAAMEQSVTR